jgi:hypothetical protein
MYATGSPLISIMHWSLSCDFILSMVLSAIGLSLSEEEALKRLGLITFISSCIFDIAGRKVLERLSAAIMFTPAGETDKLEIG